MTSSSSASSGPLPTWPIFVFLSAASQKDARPRVGVGGRGATGIIGTTGDALPTWASNRAIRFRVFSSKPIPFDALGASW